MSNEDFDTSSAIITICELIDNAFGDPEVNVVNFNHIQAILYILARQLRILERRVAVQLGPHQVQIQRSSSSLSVTEVKLHATESKKRNRNISRKSIPLRAKQKSKIDKSDIGSSEKTTSTSDEAATGKASSDKTSSYKTSSYGASSDKASTDKYDTDKTSTIDKSSTAGKSSTADKSIDKSSTAVKSVTADDDTSVGAKSTTDKTSSSGKKTTVDKSLTAGKTSTKDDTSATDKTSSGGRKSTADTSSLDRKVSVDISGKGITTQERSASATADPRSIGPQDYQKLLDEVEESRERELRVIRQRADSRDQHEKTPTPIASMDSFEETYEKLLVVERVSVEEAKARAARGRSARDESGPRLSVVTQEQFQELVKSVRHLQKKFAPVGTSDFLENAQLMEELRKGASLTDAMAALQLSARLEATEKTLTKLLSFVTDLASQMPGYEPTEGADDDIEVLFGAPRAVGKKGEQKTEKKKSTPSKPSKGQLQKELEKDISPINSVEQLIPAAPSFFDADSPDADKQKIGDIITYEELELALQNVYDAIMKQVIEKSAKSTLSAENAMKLVTHLENRIDVSINLGNRMENLETLVSNYSEQINGLDTGLSSQLVNFQEDLTQMQHDLETGLENMAEVLANTGGDATAVAELNAHFSDLQVDIDDAAQRQKDLRNIQYNLSLNLEGLRKQIEMLRETKSDRDEVADALRDKAGIGDLNGLVSHQQFDAVRGDLEKRIVTAYDKFNNQETVWQKAIDDLLRELNEKADIIQVESLRDEINHYLEELRKKMKFITDIVGEPVAAALARKLGRDATCLSCATPAHMKAEELTTPILPAMRPPTIGAEAQKPREDGDHGVCYQGYPVKHAIDPRAHICNRWCGGSHTLLKAPVSRSPPGVTITQFNRKVGQEKGTDGKMYAVDEQVPKKPCSQCIIPDPPAASKHEQDEDVSSNMVPFDWPAISSVLPSDVTPPLEDFQDIY